MPNILFTPQEIRRFRKRVKKGKPETAAASQKRNKTLEAKGRNFFRNRASMGGLVRYLTGGAAAMREMAIQSHISRRESNG